MSARNGINLKENPNRRNGKLRQTIMGYYTLNKCKRKFNEDGAI